MRDYTGIKKEQLFKTAWIKGCNCCVALLDAVEKSDGWHFLCSTGFDGYAKVWHHESSLERFCL